MPLMYGRAAVTNPEGPTQMSAAITAMVKERYGNTVANGGNKAAALINLLLEDFVNTGGSQFIWAGK